MVMLTECILPGGNHSDRDALVNVPNGSIRPCTTHNTIDQYVDGAWSEYAALGEAGAINTAAFTEQGDLLVGSGPGEFDTLAPGAEGQRLTVGPGGVLQWEVPGETLPAGGTAGQVLKKLSGTDYDVGWGDDVTLTSEQVQDILGAAIIGAGDNTAVYDDGAGTVTITGASGLDAEQVRDTIAAALVAGTNVTVTVNDAGDTITIAATGGGGGSVATDTIFDAKGDLPIGTGADAASRLALGADGTVLTADSTLTLGVKWAAPPASGAVGARYPVQDVYGGGGSSVNTRTINIAAPTAGDYLIVHAASEGAANVTSVVGGGVTTWTKLLESTASTAPHVEVWGGLVDATPTTTVVVNWGSTTFCTCSMSEWAGLVGTVDVSAVRTNSAKLYVPTLTPTDASALVINAASQTTFASGFENFSSPSLLRFSSLAGVAAASFGFPGKNPVIGAWGNSHGGNHSSVTLALL